MSVRQVEWPEWPEWPESLEFVGPVEARWRGEGQANAREQQPSVQTEPSWPVWNTSHAYAVAYAHAHAADTQNLITALERWPSRVRLSLRLRLGRCRCRCLAHLQPQLRAMAAGVERTISLVCSCTAWRTITNMPSDTRAAGNQPCSEMLSR